MKANQVPWDTVTTPSWDDAYSASTPAPWDIGRPQPAFVRLAEQGLLAGRVLDSGCGTGEQTLLAAAHGADATGVDGSGLAIGRVSQDELRAAFSQGWDVVRIEAAAFEVNEARTGVASVQAWLAVLERAGQG